MRGRELDGHFVMNNRASEVPAGGQRQGKPQARFEPIGCERHRGRGRGHGVRQSTELQGAHRELVPQTRIGRLARQARLQRLDAPHGIYAPHSRTQT